jgi:hypothetical protein
MLHQRKAFAGVGGGGGGVSGKDGEKQAENRQRTIDRNNERGREGQRFPALVVFMTLLYSGMH